MFELPSFLFKSVNPSRVQINDPNPENIEDDEVARSQLNSNIPPKQFEVAPLQINVPKVQSPSFIKLIFSNYRIDEAQILVEIQTNLKSRRLSLDLMQITTQLKKQQKHKQQKLQKRKSHLRHLKKDPVLRQKTRSVSSYFSRQN